jgi:heme-degrading monooxygenase HmoA
MREDADALYLRIVDHRVEPSLFEEMKRTWEATVLPALLETPGCLGACLLEGLRGKAQALSLTFWSDEASAIRYETSGRFDALVALVRPFLSGIYQWRLSLTEGGSGREFRGSDLAVSGFQIVSGRKLGQPGA